MRRRVIAAAAVALVAGAACEVGCGGGTDGHLRVERLAKRATTLMDEPAYADYCPADSILSILAIAPNRAGGLAVRTAFPLREPRTFRVQPLLDSLGTATAAFRPMTGWALLGTSGQIRLERGRTVQGEFQVAVAESAGTVVQLRGTFSRIPVRGDPPLTCPRR